MGIRDIGCAKETRQHDEQMTKRSSNAIGALTNKKYATRSKTKPEAIGVMNTAKNVAEAITANTQTQNNTKMKSTKPIDTAKIGLNGAVEVTTSNTAKNTADIISVGRKSQRNATKAGSNGLSNGDEVQSSKTYVINTT